MEKVLVIAPVGSEKVLENLHLSRDEMGSTLHVAGGISDPYPLALADEAVSENRDVQKVVVVGSGTIVEFAKAVAVELRYAGPLSDLVRDDRAAPLYAAPLDVYLTSGGSGDELTSSVELCIVEKRKRRSLRVEGLTPKLKGFEDFAYPGEQIATNLAVTCGRLVSITLTEDLPSSVRAGAEGLIDYILGGGEDVGSAAHSALIADFVSHVCAHYASDGNIRRLATSLAARLSLPSVAGAYLWLLERVEGELCSRVASFIESLGIASPAVSQELEARFKERLSGR